MCSHEVTQNDLHDLLKIFEKKSFEAGSYEEGSTEYLIAKRCECIFKLDYSLIEIDNTNGMLSPRYPSQIFIPEYEHAHMSATLVANGNGSATTAADLNNGHRKSNGDKNVAGDGKIDDSDLNLHTFVTFANPIQQEEQQPHPAQQSAPIQQQQQQQQPQHQQQQQQQQQKTIYEDQYDVNKIRELITMAKYARCRQRFVVPVIMYRGKYICRSATISVMPETYGRKVVDYAYDCLSGTNYAERSNNDDENADATEETLINQINEQSPFSYEEVIKSDIQLLTALNVSTIVDLMVEKRKIKYFMTVSSSEKADPENHYENFNILSLPYPGCEFFRKLRDNNYLASNLHYNWKQAFNDAIISIPKLGPAADLDICWYDYKKWDLVLITQNYLKATLKYIQDENSGMLIHCISGWDRTPLFISLVRLSLWADGLIHQTLSPLQMSYFTLAYDWYLFGHQLPDRLKRGEDIMFFCFHVLKFLTDDEFSVVEHRKRTKTSSSSGSSIIVLKSDCDEEPPKEDLNFDPDSNDSTSNNSNCDMSITDNFFTTTNATTSPLTITTPATTTTTATATTTTTATATTSTTTSTQCNNNALTNRSPNPKRSKTSPITVPGASANRQRQESTSSNGSWQVVTETGSIDSMVNGSYMMHFVAQQNNTTPSSIGIPLGTSFCNGTTLNGSGSNGDASKETTATGSTAKGTRSPPITVRKQRLNAVRAIFIQAYGKTIGLKFKEGSTMNLTTFVGTIADQLF